MTGYGRGQATQGAFKASCEISSVNRKQSEIAVYLPRELESLETQARSEVSRCTARGRITVKILVHTEDSGASAKSHINFRLAKTYAKGLKELAHELKISGELSLDTLVRIPGVLQLQDASEMAERAWPAINDSLRQALEGLIKMRTKEGQHLAKDLKQRVSTMRKAVTRVRKAAPEMVVKYREALRKRIFEAGLNLPSATDERLLKEVVYFADRSDISEELTRLDSHFKQFDECARSEEPVGRTLDFLAQEINREINTIGSKASESSIAKEVVGLKAELEKFREQVQNLE